MYMDSILSRNKKFKKIVGWLDGGTAMDDKVHKQESTIHNIAIYPLHTTIPIHKKHASWHNINIFTTCCVKCSNVVECFLLAE